jgi:hypothetical protein
LLFPDSFRPGRWFVKRLVILLCIETPLVPSIPLELHFLAPFLPAFFAQSLLERLEESVAQIAGCDHRGSSYDLETRVRRRYRIAIPGLVQTRAVVR